MADGGLAVAGVEVAGGEVVEGAGVAGEGDDDVDGGVEAAQHAAVGVGGEQGGDVGRRYGVWVEGVTGDVCGDYLDWSGQGVGVEGQACLREDDEGVDAVAVEVGDGLDDVGVVGIGDTTCLVEQPPRLLRVAEIVDVYRLRGVGSVEVDAALELRAGDALIAYHLGEVEDYGCGEQCGGDGSKPPGNV